MRIRDLGQNLNMAIASGFGGPIHRAVKKTSIVFDLDGTITKKGVWPEVGEPNPDVVAQIKRAHDAGLNVIIHSCRLSSRIHPGDELLFQRQQVLEFLKKHDIPYDQLWTSDKPLALLYVDDRSVNPKDKGAMEDAVTRAIKESKEVKP
jgi:hypothetical protein